MASTATKKKPKSEGAGSELSTGKADLSASRTLGRKSRRDSSESGGTKEKRYSSTGSSVKGSKSGSSGKGSDKLDNAQRRTLRSYDFGLPEKREFPMPDAAHVHAAESYFRYASTADKPQLARRIMAKAKKFGVDVESDTIRQWAKKKQS